MYQSTANQSSQYTTALESGKKQEKKFNENLMPNCFLNGAIGFKVIKRSIPAQQ